MIAKRAVIFVDDDQAVLDGLRNVLRRQRDKWDMTFASGGEQALNELAQRPYDVIVSDMRMPGMDGATLLTRVKQEHPGMARIILSGHAERKSVMRSLPVAHQFLDKPCDIAHLRAVIDRACELQALLQDQAIRDAVGAIEKLPSAPATYLALREAMASDATSTAAVSAIIERDPAMSAKILQLVNSAFFALPQKTSAIKPAVTYLGMELMKGLALQAHVFADATESVVAGVSLEELQRSSLGVAQLARQLGAGKSWADEAFTAGLVHDIGILVLAIGAEKRFRETLETARASRRPLLEVELETLGVSHAQIGAYLLGVWGLPTSIVEAVAFHHTPSKVTEGNRELIAALHAADVLSDHVPNQLGLAPNALDVAFIESAGLGAELPRWQALAAKQTT